jgi:hypothetical protein
MGLVRAGILTGVADGVFAVVLTLMYGRTFERLWQGVASVPFGAGMFQKGALGAAVGIALHFCVAFGWSLVMLLIVRRWPAILASTKGIALTAVIYGPLVWVIMSCAIIPLFVHKPPVIDSRWATQLIGHAFSVGLPIAWSLSTDR